MYTKNLLIMRALLVALLATAIPELTGSYTTTTNSSTTLSSPLDCAQGTGQPGGVYLRSKEGFRD
jgi:hypothetical protein